MTNPTATDRRIYLNALYEDRAGQTLTPFGMSQTDNGVYVAYSYAKRADRMFTAHIDVFRKRFAPVAR